MAQPKDNNSRMPARRRRGFEQASILLGRRVQQVAEGRGFAVTRLLTHWSEIAGEKLAGQCRPIKISHSKGGFGATLTLLTSGAVAPLVEMQLPRLRDAVNACYGYNAIQKITLTQTAPTGFAEGQAVFRPAPAMAAKPDPMALKRADQVARQFTDPQLAAAMQSFALNHADRQNRKSRKDTL